MTNPPFCPYCGKTHPPEFRFCPNTGKALPVEGDDSGVSGQTGLSQTPARQKAEQTARTQITLSAPLAWMIGAALVVFIILLAWMIATSGIFVIIDTDATATQLAAIGGTSIAPGAANEATPVSTIPVTPTETPPPPTETFTPTPTATSTATIAPTAAFIGVYPPGTWLPCGENAAKSRLMIGSYAYVSNDPPLANLLHKTAGTESSIIGRAQPGEVLYIKDGPKCKEGMVWWYVSSTKDGQVGWTGEGSTDGKYYLVPYNRK